MGKKYCVVCSKKCKGLTIKLEKEQYVHSKCFKCHQCSYELELTKFFEKDKHFYCLNDYQTLFGAKCVACGMVLKNEAMTVLGNSYHSNCLRCSVCRSVPTPGDHLHFDGKEFFCKNCNKKPVNNSNHNSLTNNTNPILSMKEPKLPNCNDFNHNICDNVDNINHQSMLNTTINDRNKDYQNKNRTSITSPQISRINYNKTQSSPGTNGYKFNIDQSGENNSNYTLESTNKYNHQNANFVMDNMRDVNHSQDLDPAKNTSQDQRKISTGTDKFNLESTLSSQNNAFNRSSLLRHSEMTSLSGFFRHSFLDLKNTFKRGPSLNSVKDPQVQHFHHPSSCHSTPQYQRSKTFGRYISQTSGSIASKDSFVDPIETSRFPNATPDDLYKIKPVERENFSPTPFSPTLPSRPVLFNAGVNEEPARSQSSLSFVRNNTQLVENGSRASSKYSRIALPSNMVPHDNNLQSINERESVKQQNIKKNFRHQRGYSNDNNFNYHHSDKLNGHVLSSNEGILKTNGYRHQLNNNQLTKAHGYSQISDDQLNRYNSRNGYLVNDNNNGLTIRNNKFNQYDYGQEMSNNYTDGVCNNDDINNHIEVLQKNKSRFINNAIMNNSPIDYYNQHIWQNSPNYSNENLEKNLNSANIYLGYPSKPGYGLKSTSIRTENVPDDLKSLGQLRICQNGIEDLNEYIDDPFEEYKRPISKDSTLKRNSIYRKTVGAFSPISRTQLSWQRPTVQDLLYRPTSGSQNNDSYKIYPYSKLRLSNLDPSLSVDRQNLEKYLSDDEFFNKFCMDRKKFYSLPEWKQNDLKKRLDLF